MKSGDLLALQERLSERDLALLADLDRFRLLTTRQLQRLHFTSQHDSTAAATRACVRVLGRLRELNLVRCLERRIGGVRRGSAGFVWHLGPVGERLQRSQRGETRRSRYGEPSRHFVAHTLAIADLAIDLIEAGRAARFELLDLHTEPGNWQSFLSPGGTQLTLKPDLAAVTASGEFEDHWYIEADLDTEHLPVVLRQCAAYQAFLASGRYQARHGVFPVVLWVVPTVARAAGIRAAMAKTKALQPNVFRVCTRAEFLAEVAPKVTPVEG